MRGERRVFDTAFVAVVALFLAGCFFANPVADDFIYAANARGGWTGAWLQEYAAWSGRYASNGLVLATPLRFGLAGYHVAAALLIVSTVLAVYLLLAAWAGDALARRDALTCSLGLTAVYLSQMPSLGEGVYWYTSAVTYHAWIVPALLYLALILRSGRVGAAPGFALVGAAALLVVAVGFNEVVAILLLVFHAMWLVVAVRTRSEDRRRAAVLLTIVGVGVVSMLLSPGNAVRRSFYVGVRHQLGRSLVWTALQSVRFYADWLTSGALLVGTAIFTPAAAELSRRWAHDPARARVWLAALIVAMALIVPIATFPAYWETGTLGQHRTVNAAYFAFLIAWFAATSLWFATGSALAGRLRAFAVAFRTPLAIALLVAVGLTGNSYTLGSELLSGRLAAFNREMAARLSRLQACRDRRQAACGVEPLREAPRSFFVLDIGPDPHDWVNAAYARYFDLDDVHLLNGRSRE